MSRKVDLTLSAFSRRSSSAPAPSMTDARAGALRRLGQTHARGCQKENVMPVRDDLAEYLGELDVPLDQRRQAMRVVASASVDADECGLLLDMLGLKPAPAPAPAASAL